MRTPIQMVGIISVFNDGHGGPLWELCDHPGRLAAMRTRAEWNVCVCGCYECGCVWGAYWYVRRCDLRREGARTEQEPSPHRARVGGQRIELRWLGTDSRRCSIA
jgi:hypothetical protein